MQPSGRAPVMLLPVTCTMHRPAKVTVTGVEGEVGGGKVGGGYGGLQGGVWGVRGGDFVHTINCRHGADAVHTWCTRGATTPTMHN